MSVHEIGTRLNQEFRKRADLAMYRAGVTPVGSSIGPTREKREFFFREDEIGERVCILKDRMPERVASVLQEADEICDHRFRLLGYEPVDYGKEIDWHLDAVHGKRTTLEPWYTIPFLDFNVAGDHKITWELNRHQHLVTVAKAWAITRNERYTREIVAQWYDWQLKNPYPLGINWASSLEVAFRSISWLWVKFLISDCAALPAQFQTDLLQALAQNGRYIESFLSTYFSPNTHLIGEAAALYFIGQLCPELRLASRWQRKGWRILQQEIVRQVRADGVYFEQALHYHVYALDFFLHVRELRARNKLEIPESFDNSLKQMLHVVSSLSQTGIPFGFGDDDGGRVFDPQRNRSVHMSDPIALGALIFGENDMIRRARLTEEAVWLFGERSRALETRNGHTPQVQSASFPQGGLYLMADPEQHAVMMIDAGPQGTGRSGHGHADALSIQLSSHGQSWLTDPGTCCYISSDGTRAAFRGTAAHNTIRVDEQDQACADGPFGWTNIPAVRAHRWVQGKTFEFFAGSHDGYMRLSDPVRHSRIVFHPHGGPWLVRDVLEGSREHDVELSWHFEADVDVRPIAGGYEATRRCKNGDQSSGISVSVLSAAEGPGEDKLETSSLSPAYGNHVPAKVVRRRTRARLPIEIATVISRKAVRESEAFGSIGHETDSVRAYRYVFGTTTHLFFLARSDAKWSCGSWSSDAAVLYCRQLEGRIAHLVCIAGSFVSYAGRDLLRNVGPLARFEWRRQGDAGETYVANELPVEHSLDREIELDSVS